MSANEQNSNIIKDKSEQKANIKDEKMVSFKKKKHKKKKKRNPLFLH